MPVDVINHIVIDRPVDVVSSYACDPGNAPERYSNIRAVEWQTEPPVGTTATSMSLRNRREPAGFSRLVAPFMSNAVRRATRKNLARLKVQLERA